MGTRTLVLKASSQPRIPVVVVEASSVSIATLSCLFEGVNTELCRDALKNHFPKVAPQG